MDTSSEMIHSLLPLFLTGVLGASALSVGLIEGVAEATAAITKVFSGAFSDRVGRRKPLVLLGYGLAAASKPAFALAPSVAWVVAARFIDRLGKGIRGAPRDALVADVTPRSQLGAAFGLRQSLDTVGAFAGPLVAVIVMAAAPEGYRLAFWLAAIPGFLAVAVILLGLREPAVHRQEEKSRLRWEDVRRLSSRYWSVIGIGAVMTMARFSEGFLLLKAQAVGLAVAWVPLVFVVMNVVYAASAYPVGSLSDRIGKRGLLLAGLAVLVAADLLLAWAHGIAAVTAGVALWGLHLGMTQGLFSALVADTAPAAMKGTAFGIYNLATGIVLFLASFVAGLLWSRIGPALTFEAGALFTGATLIALFLLGNRL
jgi:MFS family permease